MPIQELSQKLKLNAFYAAYTEQETQPAYNELPFAKRVQMLLEAEVSSAIQKCTNMHSKYVPPGN